MQRLFVVLSLMSVLSWAHFLTAQVSTASLTGLITDQTNAAAAHVQVTIVSEDTGYKRSTDTDGAGYYSFPELPIGTYSLTVTHSGFATLQQKVTLQTAQKTRRDFVLR